MYLFYFLAAVCVFCLYDAVKTYLYTVKIIIGYKLAGCGPEIVEPYILPLTTVSEVNIYEDIKYAFGSGGLALLQYLNVTEFEMLIDVYRWVLTSVSILI